MDAAQREYDRFGPWAVEISDDDPPPPLFIPYLTRTERPLLSIKIPTRLERRNARPGMDLYDYLVCLYAEDLVLMQRDGPTVATETCRYRDVQHLRVSRCLLRGSLFLALPGRAYELPYNTVSQDLMERMAGIIRERCMEGPGSPIAVEDVEPPTGALSFLFEGMLAAERRHPTGMHLLAAQGTVPVQARRGGAVRRLFARVADKRMLESMHLCDGRELKIVERDHAYAYRWQTVYGVVTSYLPLANLREAMLRDDGRNDAVELRLQTGGGDSVHVFAEANPLVPPYARFLTARPSG
jgi:hypothetical protein